MVIDPDSLVELGEAIGLDKWFVVSLISQNGPLSVWYELLRRVQLLRRARRQESMIELPGWTWGYLAGLGTASVINILLFLIARKKKFFG